MSMYQPGNAGFQSGYSPGMPGAPDGTTSGGRFTHRRAFPTLVLGILSLFLGLLAGIPAIVIGRGALRDIDGARGEVGGRGLVVTGLVLGVVGTFLGTAWLVARWVALH